MAPVAAGSGLVLGIGNVLRGDDGIGWRLAEGLAGRPDGELVVKAVHQLTPELAAELTAVRRVLFIDAWRPPEQMAAPRPRLLSLNQAIPSSAAGLMVSHQLDPAALLGLTELLYGRAPLAMVLLVPVWHCGHGSELSVPLLAQLPRAQHLLLQWLQHVPGEGWQNSRADVAVGGA